MSEALVHYRSAAQLQVSQLGLHHSLITRGVSEAGSERSIWLWILIWLWT